MYTAAQFQKMITQDDNKLKNAMSLANSAIALETKIRDTADAEELRPLKQEKAVLQGQADVLAELDKFDTVSMSNQQLISLQNRKNSLLLERNSQYITMGSTLDSVVNSAPDADSRMIKEQSYAYGDNLLEENGATVDLRDSFKAMSIDADAAFQGYDKGTPPMSVTVERINEWALKMSGKKDGEEPSIITGDIGEKIQATNASALDIFRNKYANDSSLDVSGRINAAVEEAIGNDEIAPGAKYALAKNAMENIQAFREHELTKVLSQYPGYEGISMSNGNGKILDMTSEISQLSSSDLFGVMKSGLAFGNEEVSAAVSKKYTGGLFYNVLDDAITAQGLDPDSEAVGSTQRNALIGKNIIDVLRMQVASDGSIKDSEKISMMQQLERYSSVIDDNPGSLPDSFKMFLGDTITKYTEGYTEYQGEMREKANKIGQRGFIAVPDRETGDVYSVNMNEMSTVQAGKYAERALNIYSGVGSNIVRETLGTVGTDVLNINGNNATTILGSENGNGAIGFVSIVDGLVSSKTAGQMFGKPGANGELINQSFVDKAEGIIMASPNLLRDQKGNDGGKYVTFDIYQKIQESTGIPEGVKKVFAGNNNILYADMLEKAQNSTDPQRAVAAVMLSAYEVSVEGYNASVVMAINPTIKNMYGKDALTGSQGSVSPLGTVINQERVLLRDSGVLNYASNDSNRKYRLDLENRISTLKTAIESINKQTDDFGDLAGTDSSEARYQYEQSLEFLEDVHKQFGIVIKSDRTNNLASSGGDRELAKKLDAFSDKAKRDAFLELEKLMGGE